MHRCDIFTSDTTAPFVHIICMFVHAFTRHTAESSALLPYSHTRSITNVLDLISLTTIDHTHLIASGAALERARRELFTATVALELSHHW